MPQAVATAQSRRWLRRTAGQRTSVRLQPEQLAELRTTPAADSSLAEAARLAGASPVGSHHILLAALTDPNTAAARALAGLGVDLDRALEALRIAEVTGSSDELPEDAGRRQMLITVTDDRLTLEASDSEIVQLGRAAADALRESAGLVGPPAETGDTGEPGEPGDTAETGDTERAATPAGADAVIRGDHPLSVSLGVVWQSLHDSLADIRRRATATTAAEQAAGGEPPGGEPPAAPPEEAAAGN
ncbi:MAG: Clp protease N-terminal domain-containing protein [Streptosporangiaceae bacterium]